mgnify:CR=1 FL=1
MPPSPSVLDTLRALAPRHPPAPARARLPLVVAAGVHPAPGQVVLGALRTRPAPEDSEDLARILALPRRPPVDLDGVRGEALVELMGSRLRLPPGGPPCSCAAAGRPCITRLQPAQAWALWEAALVGAGGGVGAGGANGGGLLAPVGVGHGKTGLDIMIARVIPGCRQAVLLIPPGLRTQLLADYRAWAAHWRVPTLVLDDRGYVVPGAPVVHVLPYSILSRPESTDLLERLAPDLVIADEAHKLRHAGTATTRRVLRYFAAHPSTRLVAWSGTLTSKSILDYSHLSALALGEGSPLPLDPQAVAAWALAIDPSDWPAPLGALSALCRRGEHVHRAYYRRLTETRGVVATRAGAVDASILLCEREAPEIPQRITDLLTQVRKEWTRPDGEELVDAMAVEASARTLAAGFYYQWRFPRGEPEDLIDRWFASRKAWHRELRERLKVGGEHLDSPLLCAQAAVRGWAEGGYDGELPIWRAESWPAWVAIRDLVHHESEAVWIDDYLARDAAAWARSHRGIVWWESTAFGARVAEIAGLPLHGGGPGAEAAIRAEDGRRSVVASIKAHGTGRDGLQHLFASQLVAQPPSSGAAWEQLLGRLHRIGQAADEVSTWVYRHTREMADAVDRAVRLARYIEGTTGSLQKLLLASCDFELQST